MQDLIYLFPYEEIEKGSNVIIYGAGNVGQSFLGQIAMTGYCNVVAVADRAYDKYPYLGQTMIPPEKIPEYEYDRVVIAVDGDTRLNAMKDVLAGMGITDEKIVSGSGRLFEAGTGIADDTQAVAGKESDVFEYSYTEDDKISIAFFLAGGLGDCIIDKKFIQALVDKADTEVAVDIYGDMYNEESIRSFFRDCSYVRNMISGKILYHGQCRHYDAAISLLSFAIVDNINEESIGNKSNTFPEVLIKLKKAIEEYGLEGGRLGEAGIHFERMKYRRQNCYTFFSYNGLLDINDMNVPIGLDPGSEMEFRKLDLPPKYITVNYGWGNNIHGEYKVPNKVWPFEYYEQLVSMIKRRFGDLCVVQTGTKTSPKISNADRYVFDTGLDTLEYVLRDSVLHFDCESGLVHLATQLGTKCVVVFGPTLPEVFGYPQNENILSTSCSGCRALMDDFSMCLHTDEDRECMYSIKPETVYESIEKELIQKGF